MSADERLGRLLKLLQGSIRAAGFTQTEIDERIGRRRGYLSHVFQRRVDLKLIDLLQALDALEIDPRRFFTAALGGSTGPLEGLMQLVAESPRKAGGQLWEAVRPSAPAQETVDDEELMTRVRAAVRSILAEQPAASDS